MSRYLGRVFDSMTLPDGSVEYMWLYAYILKGERRFALTEEAARLILDSDIKIR